MEFSQNGIEQHFWFSCLCSIVWSVSFYLSVVFRQVFRLGTRFDKIDKHPPFHPSHSRTYKDNAYTSPNPTPNYPRQDPHERSIASSPGPFISPCSKKPHFHSKEKKGKKEGSRKLLNKFSSVLSYSLQSLELLASIFMCFSLLLFPGHCNLAPTLTPKGDPAFPHFTLDLFH